MQAYIALIRREMLEHRGAFLYAPALLLIALVLLLTAGIVFGNPNFDHTPEISFTAVAPYQLGLLFIMGGWSAYLLIALFFYYADSFSADRRNNSLLFWKSMPQSDLKVLASKALSGITIFPTLIFIFSLMTGLLLYPLTFLAAAKVPFIPLIGPVDMLWAWLQVGITGLVYFLLTILWYAPFLGWVAGLSTLVQRWSIPLAFVIPGVVVIAELITSYGGPRPIANYLSVRGENFLENVDLVEVILHADGQGPLSLIGIMFANIDWVQMIIGLAFTGIVVYLASEYRRRRIDA